MRAIHNINSTNRLRLDPGDCFELKRGLLIALVESNGKDAGLFYVFPGSKFYHLEFDFQTVQYLPVCPSQYTVGKGYEQTIDEKNKVIAQMASFTINSRHFAYWKVLNHLYYLSETPFAVPMRERIEVQCSRHHIGMMVNLSREMVGRAYNYLLEKNFIEQGRTIRYATVPTDKFKWATHKDFAHLDPFSEERLERISATCKETFHSKKDTVNANKTNPRRNIESDRVGTNSRVEPIPIRSRPEHESKELHNKPEGRSDSDARIGWGW